MLTLYRLKNKIGGKVRCQLGLDAEEDKWTGVRAISSKLSDPNLLTSIPSVSPARNDTASSPRRVACLAERAV